MRGTNTEHHFGVGRIHTRGYPPQHSAQDPVRRRRPRCELGLRLAELAACPETHVLGRFSVLSMFCLLRLDNRTTHTPLRARFPDTSFRRAMEMPSSSVLNHTASGQPWHYNGTASLYCAGAVTAQCKCLTCASLVLYWYKYFYVLLLSWYCKGAVLVCSTRTAGSLYWYCTGAVLVLCWNRSSDVEVLDSRCIGSLRAQGLALELVLVLRQHNADSVCLAGTVRVMCSSCTGIALCGHCTGTTLALHSHCFVTALVPLGEDEERGRYGGGGGETDNQTARQTEPIQAIAMVRHNAVIVRHWAVVQFASAEPGKVHNLRRCAPARAHG